MRGASFLQTQGPIHCSQGFMKVTEYLLSLSPEKRQMWTCPQNLRDSWEEKSRRQRLLDKVRPRHGG